VFEPGATTIDEAVLPVLQEKFETALVVSVTEFPIQSGFELALSVMLHSSVIITLPLPELFPAELLWLVPAL
jgi:hypothetical protein